MSAMLLLYNVGHMRLLSPHSYRSLRQFTHSQALSLNLRESYRLLQLPEDSEVSHSQVKEAYLHMAKLYHPDSGAPTADAAIFSQIEQAYRDVLAHLARQRVALTHMQAEADEDNGGVKRQSPQHRQYLSYEGVGLGTPSQRERQYRQIRVDRASEQVLDYRRQKLERAAANDEGAITTRELRRHSRQIKITQAVERLVEDLIMESMARGDFRNLAGSGKPLSKFDHNPYADPMTHNLNRILIDNGYQPPWIVAHKEIREMAHKLRGKLLRSRAKLGDPLTPGEEGEWKQCCQDFGKELTQLNKKVDSFNLIVPLLSRQMVHFSLQRELDRVLKADRERRVKKEREWAQEMDRQSSEEKDRRNSSKNISQRLLLWMQSLLR